MNTGFKLFGTETAEGAYPQDTLLVYKFLYRDVNDIPSEPVIAYVGSLVTSPAATYTQVVLYMAPAPFDASLESMEIYRGYLSEDLIEANLFEPAVGVTYYVYNGRLTYGGKPYRRGQYLTGTSGAISADAGVKLLLLPEDFFWVGKVLPGDEGVFVDTVGFVEEADEGTKLSCLEANTFNYESHIRWSEPGNPTHIRPSSVTVFREGDGDEITGRASLYGNLIVLKENSMHRVTMMSPDIDNPISRRDEISPDIGCIAPGTVCTIDNTLFFLSWSGLMMYDNNVLKTVSNAFSEELLYRMRSTPPDALRDAGCGYDPVFKELLLNIPSIGSETYHGYTRTVRGHIYVLALEKGYATKYGYSHLTGFSRRVRSQARWYFTNSMGELRSAEMRRPANYAMLPIVPDTDTVEEGIFYVVLEGAVTYDGATYRPDDLFIGTAETDATGDGLFAEVPRIRAWVFKDSPQESSNDQVLDVFLAIQSVPIEIFWESKEHTGGKESVIKRVRKAILNVWSEYERTIHVKTITRSNDDDRIDNNAEGYITSHTFPASNASSQNILSIVPNTVAAEAEPPLHWDDQYGRAIRVSLILEGRGRTQLNSYALHWRTVQTYLA